jgi:hypothetical protein
MRDVSARNGEHSAGRALGISFAAGVLTAGAISALILLFVGYRIGYTTIWENTGFAFSWMALDIPAELLDELAAKNGVIDNAGNPTGAVEHDTIIVRPDETLGYVLRRGVSVDAYQLRAVDAVNLDPPVVYTPAGADFSPELRRYLDENTRVRYTYNVTDEGFRRTLPAVASDRKILMVGDSGVFGVGVDDGGTIASSLQRIVGSDARVVNAGVAGYGGKQCFLVAKSLTEVDDYALLVYVAHHNDFYEPRHISNPDKARRILADFASIGNRFEEGVVVALLTAMEFNSEDVLRSAGWSQKRIDTTHSLRDELPGIVRSAGFAYLDWTDVVDEVRSRERTIFAPWSLYVDRSHLAPAAAQLFSERIHELFPKAGALAGSGTNAIQIRIDGNVEPD